MGRHRYLLLLRFYGEHLPGDDRSATFILEDLLDAQERRTQAESQLVTAKVNYLVSIARLQQAMGTLLINEGIQPIRSEHCGDTQITFVKGGTQ